MRKELCKTPVSVLKEVKRRPCRCSGPERSIQPSEDGAPVQSAHGHRTTAAYADEKDKELSEKGAVEKGHLPYPISTAAGSASAVIILQRVEPTRAITKRRVISVPASGSSGQDPAIGSLEREYP